MTGADDLGAGLAPVMARIGRPAPQALERLSGGANMESWRLRCGAEDYVLRRAPQAALMESRPLDHAGEARVIRAAHAAGVPAPAVAVELLPADNLGSGFVMHALPGTPDPATILAESDPDALLHDLATTLAMIHRVDPAIPGLPTMDTAAALAELKTRFLNYGGDRPVIALALAWLEAHLPRPVVPRLVHGDFRLGNLLVEDGRLTGVLDWELAHAGDPHEDLAYGCMTVWRFARPDRPAFGLGSTDAWLSAYQAAGGSKVDRARFRFWLVYRTCWWALGCLQMGSYWRSGADRSVERVVIGRRTAEQELDLLLLLEEEAPDAERERTLPSPPEPATTAAGEPSAAEIVTAVGEWLAAEVRPLVSGRGRFDLAVARNALGIVARELAGRPDPHDALLSADLLAGRQTLATPGLLARLRRITLDTLAADMPKYPALAMARALWEGTT